MKFKSFRIKNFRSIIDSGENSLAHDNITALIGQNESGKTSVLESLTSFYTGEISENVLRNDMSLPSISCTFEIDKKKFSESALKNGIPEFIISTIEKNECFKLTRQWIDEKNNRLLLDNPEIVEHYQTKIKVEAERIETIQSEIKKLTIGMSFSIENLAQLKIKKQNILDELNNEKFDFEKLEANHKRDPKNEELKKAYEAARIENEKNKIRLDKIEQNITDESKNVNTQNDITKYASKTMDVEKSHEAILKDIKATEQQVRLCTEQREYASSPRKRRNFQRKLDNLNRILSELRRNEIKIQDNLRYHYFVFEKLLNQTPLDKAEELAKKEIADKSELPDLVEIGDILFEKTPKFEFFEDFSSLLPDRIDLEDIINNNQHTEGFKAATNFLRIAGLTSEFFNHKSNRILKQKIENLNGEINVDFHEYWQQKIGKENKIKINFELEHYDFQNPEKKGKPYLEFWIKDDKERLYPKQRSRGVRWFLSFYLELKAKALDKDNSNMVLLIDEPGVSLHARAQEDVLKVFEDIKTRVQVIYTTHSPHLINPSKLYRLLAVQRAKEGDDYSESLVFDARSLGEASADTLSPIYTLMGTKISDQQMMQKKNNVIVEDLVSYYYLTIFLKLLNINQEIYILPATDVNNVTTLVNILLGWRMGFIVLVDDDKSGNAVYNDLKRKLYNNDDELASEKILVLDKCQGIEDIFSTIDFKNHILMKRVGITETNSEYIAENKLSRTWLASSFQNQVETGKIDINSFDDETKNNIKWITERIINTLKD